MDKPYPFKLGDAVTLKKICPTSLSVRRQAFLRAGFSGQGDRDGVPVSARQLRTGGADRWARVLRPRVPSGGRVAAGFSLGVRGIMLAPSLCAVHHHRGLLPPCRATDGRERRQERSAERFPCGSGRHAAFPRGRRPGTRSSLSPTLSQEPPRTS